MNKVAIAVVGLVLAVAAGLVSFTYIAMAQSSDEVTLEADIIPALDFTVDFGDGLRTVTITNTGAWNLSVTCNAAGSYIDGLELDGEPWSSFDIIIERGGHQEIDVTLTVPESYTGVGESGTIIFWAAEAR